MLSTTANKLVSIWWIYEISDYFRKPKQHVYGWNRAWDCAQDSTVASATNISSLVTKNSGLLIIIEKTTMLKPVRDNLSLYMYVV